MASVTVTLTDVSDDWAIWFGRSMPALQRIFGAGGIEIRASGLAASEKAVAVVPPVFAAAGSDSAQADEKPVHPVNAGLRPDRPDLKLAAVKRFVEQTCKTGSVYSLLAFWQDFNHWQPDPLVKLQSVEEAKAALVLLGYDVAVEVGGPNGMAREVVRNMSPRAGYAPGATVEVP